MKFTFKECFNICIFSAIFISFLAHTIPPKKQKKTHFLSLLEWIYLFWQNGHFLLKKNKKTFTHTYTDYIILIIHMKIYLS